MSRTHYISCAIFVSVVLLTLPTHAQAPGSVHPLDQTDPIRIQMSWPHLAKAKRVIAVPPKMTRAECDRYAAILTLSPEQKQYLYFLHDTYVEDCRILEEKSAPELIAAAEQLAALTATPPVRYPEYALAEEAMLFSRERFTSEVHNLERALFLELRSVLDETHQRPLLRRVEMHRERARSLTMHRHVRITKTAIDLCRMIESGQFGKDIPPELDAVMWAYEQELTPLRVSLDEDSLRVRATYSVLKAEYLADENGQPRDMNDPAIAERVGRAWREGIIETQQKSADVQKRIARLNDSYLPKFLQHIPSDHAESFNTAYLARAYRRVYPDQTDPLRLYRDVMTRIEISDDLRIAIESQWSAYRGSYETICSQMRRATDDRQELGATSDSTIGWQEHNAKMAKWTEDRMNVNEKFINQLTTTLPPNVLETVRSDIDAWKRELERQRETAVRRGVSRSVDFS